MATQVDVDTLRRLIAESEDVAPYQDATLSARIDVSPNLNTLARDIWMEKAAAYAALVNTTEGGSSRNMGDLYKQALSMAGNFSKLAPEPIVPGRGTRVTKLTR